MGEHFEGRNVLKVKRIKSWISRFTAMLKKKVFTASIRAAQARLQEELGDGVCMDAVHEVVVGRTTDKIYIVMDYVPVELGTLMINMGDQPFSLADSKCLLKQLLDAVSFLHDRLLVHRDIKPTNILYHGSGPKLGTLVLCDFGLTRRLSKNTVGGGDGEGGGEGQPPQQQLSPLVVTLYYRAVEILLGNGYYDESIDVWSIGCVFAELMLNKVLLPGTLCLCWSSGGRCWWCCWGGLCWWC